MPAGTPGTNYAAEASPACRAAAVTPDDANDLPGGLTLGLYIGGAGNLSVVLADDTTRWVKSQLCLDIAS